MEPSATVGGVIAPTTYMYEDVDLQRFIEDEDYALDEIKPSQREAIIWTARKYLRDTIRDGKEIKDIKEYSIYLRVLGAPLLAHFMEYVTSCKSIEDMRAKYLTPFEKDLPQDVIEYIEKCIQSVDNSQWLFRSNKAHVKYGPEIKECFDKIQEIGKSFKDSDNSGPELTSESISQLKSILERLEIIWKEIASMVESLSKKITEIKV